MNFLWVHAVVGVIKRSLIAVSTITGPCQHGIYDQSCRKSTLESFKTPALGTSSSSSSSFQAKNRFWGVKNQHLHLWIGEDSTRKTSNSNKPMDCSSSPHIGISVSVRPTHQVPGRKLPKQLWAEAGGGNLTFFWYLLLLEFKCLGRRYPK